MGYELHIEREGDSIKIEEWIEAVNLTKNIRLINTKEIKSRLPSGLNLSMNTETGDVEVLFENKGFLGIGKKEEWKPLIRFSNGIGSFKYVSELESKDNNIRKIIFSLSKKLSAKIIGDEGEVYFS